MVGMCGEALPSGVTGKKAQIPESKRDCQNNK